MDPGLHGEAANGGYPGDAEWNRQHRKRHKAWLARFIERWPLRERLAERAADGRAARPAVEPS